MKAVDVATKNHVPTEHILSICAELGIPCQDGDSDISDKDLFLVEKKMEVTKIEQAKKMLERKKKSEESAKSEKGKKIKLKRKVHVSSGLKDDKTEETLKEGGEVPSKKQDQNKIDKKETPEGNKQKEQKDTRSGRDTRKPGDSRDTRPKAGAGRVQYPGRDKRPGEKKAGEAPGDRKEASKEFGKDTTRRKYKGKGKEKDAKKRIQEEKEEREKDIFIRKKKQIEKDEAPVIVIPKKIDITESISIGDLSHKLNVKAKEVISKLMNLGVMATINQVIDAETAELLAGEYNTEVNVVSLYEDTIIRQNEEDKSEDNVFRPPIVTVMGHVDHGKTKLLDTIRKTNVVDQEFGGITQHIGAYRIKTGDHYITFLDTPGHEAFTTMRARGAKVTDIVILVVAVNDGVMNQTIEAIDHARAAEVPIIVAINKIDLPDTNPAKVRQELANYSIIPEEWGGNDLFVEISAKMNMNVDKLLELILIQAEMLELKANPRLMAKGTVLEARLDPGKGPVPTILVQHGTLKVGDPFVVGIYSGKVRAMFDDLGNTVIEAGPSTPVEILGITGMPSAGDPFQVVESEKYSKQIAQKRQELKRFEISKKVKKVTLENLNEMIKEGQVQELRIIIKADVDGSVQALKESLEKLSSVDIRVKVIHAGTGSINDSDVILAAASEAIIIGYHVRPTAKVAELAEKEKVVIKYYNIIFEATDNIKAALQGMVIPEIKEEIVGTGEIKQTFKISKLGTIAGAVVLTGKVQRTNSIRLIRDGIVIFDTKIKTLKRFQDEISEVDVGQECGFTVEAFNDIKEGDTFEAYKLVEVEKILDI